jgi:hypothetical protein
MALTDLPSQLGWIFSGYRQAAQQHAPLLGLAAMFK